VPPENAGGEIGGAAERTPTAWTTPAPGEAQAGATGPDWIARGLALAALLAIATTTIVRRRQS
jgi:hypothetical protein